MVRLNLGNETPESGGQFIELGPADKIIMAHSSSSPGTFHFAIALADPVVVKRFGGEVTYLCSCPGFHNHRKCWHVAWLMEDETNG